MKPTALILAAALSTAGLAACDKKPADVPTPTTTTPTPSTSSTAPMADTPASDPSMPPSNAASGAINAPAKP